MPLKSSITCVYRMTLFKMADEILWYLTVIRVSTFDVPRNLISHVGEKIINIKLIKILAQLPVAKTVVIPYWMLGHLPVQSWSRLGSHYGDVIKGAMAWQITSLTIDYSTAYSGADLRKHQSSASLAFVPGIRRSPLNSPHKWLVTRKMFPFDDVIVSSMQE